MAFQSTNNPAGTSTIVTPLTGRDTALADQGNYFVACNATPGTGVIGFATPTTLAIGEANPYLYLFNPGPATVYPAYLRLMCTVVPTNSTATRFQSTVDVGNKLTSTTSGTAMTVNCTNMGQPQGSRAVITIGTNVCNAPNVNSRRLIGQALFRPTISIVNDVYQVSFGEASMEPIAPVATLGNFSYMMPAPVIPPNCNWSFVFWAGSTSAGITLEAELGFFEK